jgi:hypothetical protein
VKTPEDARKVDVIKLKNRRKKFFTPEVLILIPKWVYDGKTVAAMASMIGCTPNTLKVSASKFCISLKSPKKKALPPTLRSLVPVPPSKNITVSTSTEVSLGLKRFSYTIGIKPTTLVRVLLERIVLDDLFIAVLDDDLDAYCMAAE